MKHEWSAKELVEHWTRLPSDEPEVQTKRGAARLGFAVLLKYFQYEGRFPDRPQDIPPVIVAHLAQQVGVAADQWETYDWHRRTIKAHRAEIRSRLGFREPTVADGEARVAWLCASVLPTTPAGEHVLLAVYAHLRDLRIEPPTPDRLGRLVESALHTLSRGHLRQVGENKHFSLRFRFSQVFALGKDPFIIVAIWYV